MLVVVIAVVGGVMALPCVTHRLLFVNGTQEPAVFQVTVRGEELWRGTLNANETRNIPVVSSTGWDPLEARVTFPNDSKRRLVGHSPYAFGHPHNTDIFIFLLTPRDGVHAVSMKHPFITAYQSKFWQQTASLVLVFYNVLSCGGFELRGSPRQ
jgi:hypothetical protein